MLRKFKIEVEIDPDNCYNCPFYECIERIEVGFCNDDHKCKLFNEYLEDYRDAKDNHALKVRRLKSCKRIMKKKNAL